MKWFKPKYSVCSECQVHFEPATGNETRWGRWCPTHRKPIIEKDLRRDAVLAWAGANWEKLEPMYKQEREQMGENQKGILQELGKQYMDSLSPVSLFGGLGLDGLGKNKK